MFFTKGDPALMLKYQTDLSLDDKQALRMEAEDIWKEFRLNVEQAGLKNAIISAHETPKGLIIKKSRGVNFVVNKNDSGVWEFRG